MRVCYLSTEVSVDCNKVVQLCEDLPEDLVIHLTSLPWIKVRCSTRIKGHVTNHQSKTTRGWIHSVRLEWKKRNTKKHCEETEKEEKKIFYRGLILCLHTLHYTIITVLLVIINIIYNHHILLHLMLYINSYLDRWYEDTEVFLKRSQIKHNVVCCRKPAELTSWRELFYLLAVREVKIRCAWEHRGVDGTVCIQTKLHGLWRTHTQTHTYTEPQC